MRVQSEYKEQREGERRAKKTVRIKLFPMLLYCFFILACGFYAYVRVLFGMGGLVTGLKVYSYIVLVIELLGALNMVFYGCWLFAKPVNDDVFPRADASTVRYPHPPMHCRALNFAKGPRGAWFIVRYATHTLRAHTFSLLHGLGLGSVIMAAASGAALPIC